MSKWTNDPTELKRISEISQKIVGMAIVEVTLDSGQTLEGVIRNLSMGNNASTALKDGRWLYYGNFDIETIEGRRFNLDMCNVKHVVNVWQQRKKAYEYAGLISIV